MSNQSDVGHTKNVANFEELITLLNQLGNKYNPPKAELSLPLLQQKLAAAKTSLQAVSASLVAYQKAVDAKQEVYEEVQRTSSRVLNMFKASTGDDAMVESLTSLVKKIRGGGNPAKKTQPLAENTSATEIKEVKTRSVSQRSHTMVAEHLQQVTDLIRVVPGYTPNEADLQLSGLESLLLSMKTKGQAATEAEVSLQAARTLRNNNLYADKDGIITIGTNIKKYVSAAFTVADPGYKQIVDISFKKI